MRAFRALKLYYVFILYVCTVVLFGISSLYHSTHNSQKFFAELLTIPREFKCRDWHDYKFIFMESQRHGIGEHGSEVLLTDASEIERNLELFKETGYDVVVSDKISVNRSIPDTRHPECFNYQYPQTLPNVSIIIIFHNEVFSVLKRTIHSVVNRTPPELLHEIILVNDLSTKEYLYGPLEDYVKENFKRTKIRIKNLKERKGLIVTRLEGAEIATGEVLVFFDSHTEVNTNWLPPLLAPIKANRRLATNPTIDYFNPKTFKVHGAPHYSDRNAFDWDLVWHMFPRKVPEGYNKLKPYPNPVMLGCAFAIDRTFFMEELGGYDREFRIWNAENYELSFKLWLCADGLYEVPCSRITHTFRNVNPSRANVGYDYVGRNFKRLVEVWFDDYKYAVYDKNRERYDKIDPGDLTEAKAIRERLNCKNFSYFLHYVVPEMKIRYPIDKILPIFASGWIESQANSSICLDYVQGQNNETVRLKTCHKNDKIPVSQFFQLNFNKNIIFGYTHLCLDSWNMNIMGCHLAESGNQYWKYNRTTGMIRNKNDSGDKCITADFEAEKLFMKTCDESDLKQKWKFSYENITALNDWTKIYGYEHYVYGGQKVDWSSMLPLEYDEECPIK